MRIASIYAFVVGAFVYRGLELWPHLPYLKALPKGGRLD